MTRGLHSSVEGSSKMTMHAKPTDSGKAPKDIVP